MIPGWVAVFSHGLAAHLDAMGVVDQTVEDTVGDGRISDLLVPARASEAEIRHLFSEGIWLQVLADARAPIPGGTSHRASCLCANTAILMPTDSTPETGVTVEATVSSQDLAL